MGLVPESINPGDHHTCVYVLVSYFVLALLNGDTGMLNPLADFCVTSRRWYKTIPQYWP